MENRMKRYEKIAFLGEGQFATVYKARNVETDELVAVKKIKIGSAQDARDGINRTALREIKLLQEVKHPNIIGLLDIFGYGSNVSLVFDFMDTDLEVIIKDTRIVFSPSHIKAYVLMTLLGLEYLHDNWILHRGMTLLQDYVQFKPFPGTPLKMIFTAAPDDLLELISALLNLNPLKRLDCKQTLKLPYFSNRPPPAKGNQLPLPSNLLESDTASQRFNNRKRKLSDPIEGYQPKRLAFS